MTYKFVILCLLREVLKVKLVEAYMYLPVIDSLLYCIYIKMFSD